MCSKDATWRAQPSRCNSVTLALRRGEYAHSIFGLFNLISWNSLLLAPPWMLLTRPCTLFSLPCTLFTPPWKSGASAPRRTAFETGFSPSGNHCSGDAPAFLIPASFIIRRYGHHAGHLCVGPRPL